MSQDIIELEPHELEIINSVLSQRGMAVDSSKTAYTLSELNNVGIYRESYSFEEVRAKGFDSSGVITSFDEVAAKAQKELRVDAPFAKGIKKWQLPIDVAGFRIITTVFPPATTVLAHVHKSLDEHSKSGGFRMVVEGSITFEGKKFLPGDWFFIPNDTPYSFETDPNIETKENYWYGHNLRGEHSRISSPVAQKI